MLQKGFFITEPFNPDPFWDNTVVNLSGAQKFEKDTVFPAGRYSVDVQAGSSGDNENVFRFAPRKIIQTFVVNSPFIIRAYCGSRGWGNQPGLNPYVGSFKVNGTASVANIPNVSHIFGNAGSAGGGVTGGRGASGGNCLGNGAVGSTTSSSGAGSCLHFVPVGGIFGTDYFYAVHIAPSGEMGAGNGGGGGSAYGGAGSGSASSSTTHGFSTKNGGTTPFGQGGAGVYASAGPTEVHGKNGSGIGAGFGGKALFNTIPQNSYGGAAYFNGTTWVDANSNGLFGGQTEDGHIIVKFLGPLN